MRWPGSGRPVVIRADFPVDRVPPPLATMN